MDYGKLTDHNSRTVDFRNTILIMTSNVGAGFRKKWRRFYQFKY